MYGFNIDFILILALESERLVSLTRNFYFETSVSKFFYLAI